MVKTLGIGLVRNEDYIGFYLNMTAWYINATTNVIQISLRNGSKRIGVPLIWQSQLKEFGINF